MTTASASSTSTDPGSADAKPLRIALFGSDIGAAEVAAYLGCDDYELTLVDRDPQHLERAAKLGYQTARLDYRDDSALAALRLQDRLDAVFCLFPDDAENVFLTISLRALAPQLRIITIAHDADTVTTLHAAGANKVIDIHDITGRRIWELLKHPNVTDLVQSTLFGQTPLNLAEIEVEADTLLHHAHLADLQLAERYNLIVTGVVDHAMRPRTDTTERGPAGRLQQGDTLLVIGPLDDIARLRADLKPSPAAS